MSRIRDGDTASMPTYIALVAVVLLIGLLVLLIGMRFEHRRPPGEGNVVVESTGPPAVLPLLGLVVLMGGVGSSALLAVVWPLQRFEDEISLIAVGANRGVEGAQFNWPLFLLGAGPSLIGSTVLFAASAIVNELRKTRFATTVAAMESANARVH